MTNDKILRRRRSPASLRAGIRLWRKKRIVLILMMGLAILANPSFLAAQEKSTPPRLGEAGPPGITQVTITTSGRADYRYFTLENPPRLVIHFASKNVFNDYFQGQQGQKEEFSEGILASMEVQYYPKPEGLPLGKAEGQTRTPLQGLILTLRSPTTYQVIEEENAIVVMLKDTSLVTKEEGIPTELAITHVVSGPKDLTAEQKALIDTFSLAKAKQMASAVQPAVQSKRPRLEMAYGWLLLLPLMGFIWFVLRVLFMRGGRGKKENLSVAKMIANLGDLQEKLTEQESQVRAEGETRRKTEQALGEIRSAMEQTKTELVLEKAERERVSKEKQGLVEKLETQVMDEFEKRNKVEQELQETKARMEQIQTEFASENAERKKVLGELEKLLQKEQREFPRIELKENGVLIRIQTSPEEFFNSRPLNLSAGGCCLKVASDWVFRGDVELCLFFFGNPHPIHGIARKIWERKETPRQTLVGIAFDSISEQDRSRICQYVEKQ